MSFARPASRRSAREAIVVALSLALAGAVTSSGAAHAESRARSLTEAPRRALVKLAEVASNVEAGTSTLPNLTEALRSDAEAEIAAIDWSSAGVRKPYLVSASVLRLEARREDGALRAQCTVSVTIREAQSGSILAIVEGRARSESGNPRPSGDDAAARAERGALSGAVHGAVSSIAEAIRRVSN